MRVLLADGDESLLEILRSFLWDRGYEAEIAANGMECLTMLRKFRPGVLVLDQALLWGGSEGLLALLRHDPRISRLAVIMTADTPLEDCAPVQTPVVAWLQKPFRLRDLLGRISALRGNALRADPQVGAKRITFFLQSCPVCGRTLRVPLHLLGQAVLCQHCRISFVAQMNAGDDGRQANPYTTMQARAEALLADTTHAARSSPDM